MKEIILNNIRSIRAAFRMTQDEFADLFKISRAAVGAYEEGRSTPPLELILRISRHYGITVDDFISKNVVDVWRCNIEELLKDGKQRRKAKK
jgi:transcriptional regulator with XRE-family HTH domain